MLPVLSKVLEKIVYLRVVSHIEGNNLLFVKQFGFRKNHSTADVLYQLLHEILDGWETHMSAIGVFIDLKKAFDTVSHNIVLKKLNALGISGHLFNWFTSYLSNRSQFCEINGVKSAELEMNVGVPQGSLLGVLLFQITIDDLRKSLRFSSAILYADDTTIIIIGSKIAYLTKKLQHDLNSLSMWLRTNKLYLNVKKTKFIYFSRRPYCDNIELYMENEKIEQVNTFKFLGCHLDNKLNFEMHYYYLIGRLQRAMFLLRKLKMLVSKEILKSIYFAHFHSVLTYCIGTWYDLMNREHKVHLFVLQKQAIRLICNVGPRTHCMPLFRKLKILVLEDIVVLEYCKLVHKSLYNQRSPRAICNLMGIDSGIIQQRSISVKTKKYNSLITYNSFCAKAVISWNRLLIETKKHEKPQQFKRAVKNSLIEKY